MTELRSVSLSLAEMRERKEIAERCIRDLEHGLKTLREENNILIETVQAKSQELLQRDRTLVDLTNVHKNTSDEMLTMRNKISELDQRYLHAVAECDKLSRMLGEKEAYLKTMSIEKEATERALEMIRKDFHSKSEKEQQMFLKLTELESKSMRLVAENDRLQRLISDKEIQMGTLREYEIGFWKMEATVKERDEMVETQRMRIVQLEAQFENLLRNFDQLSAVLSEREEDDIKKKEESSREEALKMRPQEPLVILKTFFY